MMDDEEEVSLFSIEESKRQLEFLIEAGIIKKEQLKGCGIRTTVIREYYEKEKKRINKESYLKLNENLEQRHSIYNK